MPILGIIASSYPAVSTSYESIATVTVGSGGVSSVTFSSIPSTYTHLQIRGISRSTRSLTVQEIWAEINGDTGSNNRSHILYGEGTVSSVDDGVAAGRVLAGYSAGANATASVFGGFVTDILDYTSTNKNKTIRVLGGADNNGSGAVIFGSGLYFATPAAITSIKLYAFSGNLAQYSHFALYGIKSA